MIKEFHRRIKNSLANPSLQTALDSNAARRKIGRDTAYASLPEELQTIRQRAHAVRARTIDHLDTYLNQFIARVVSNGTIVHRAQDAEQARQITLAIINQNDARLIIKSKTMVGEEIKINPELEQAGIRVVETDLGEYIVQLRGEPPSHIITPAVHLRREDVAATFQDELNVPYNESISVMTETARRVLRNDFLNADVGISGVNFGVVESGSICILTNEGNGRLVTTLPPVHIAFMGIERLVPTMEDLALMLYLLPRSATGQKLTVYTSLLHGPRREDEFDGPQQRHLILIDNGRSTLRQSALAEILYCIRCAACINACPVFREIGGHAYVSTQGEGTPYPGPIGSVLSPGLFGQEEFGHLARASSLCGACKEACPVDIDLPKLLLRVRSGGVPGKTAVNAYNASRPTTHAPRYLSLGLRMYTWFATSPGRFSAALRLAGLGGRLLAPFSNWIKMPASTGWGYKRDFPRPAIKPFRAKFKKAAKDIETSSPPTSSPPPSIPTPSSPSPSPFTPPPSPLPPIDRFETELTALGGTFIRCQESQVGDFIISFLHERKIDAIQSWATTNLPDGLLETLQSAGIRVHISPHASLRAGLTGALAGIAETGTLVVTAGEGQPQTASLLPEIHIAILRSKDIHENLPQVLNLREVKDASSAFLISGPSRTADIEMTLTIGVHGPREVHVVCVEE
ncbi:MAG: LUD domain-containing protein [Chloroflexota bacterium]|nr:LUD domain-containing protein [Chloroflexota bacterium]